jgi:hypothetical protein
MEINPLCQINYSTRVNGANEVIERSLLVNIRADKIEDAITTFQSLKQKLGNIEDTKPQLIHTAPTTAIKTGPVQTSPQCSRCHVPLIKRTCKKSGSRYYNRQFWSCPNWARNGCLETQPV